MENEGKPIFFKVFLVALLLVVINGAYFFYNFYKYYNKGVSGFSIKTTFFTVKNTLSDNYSSMSVGIKIFLIVQWALIVGILTYAATRDRRLKNKLFVKLVLNDRNNKVNKTDLDTLYDTLKKDKELKISTIASSFDISRDNALEWAHILESGDLATIEYPGFGEPILRIIDNENKFVPAQETTKIEDEREINNDNDKTKEDKKEIKNEDITIEDTKKEFLGIDYR
ncbi:MAG: hypothetical protein Q8N99_01610 [Nanoarchaeota archaeon]|nr:hypothetical protein [Nanoarchaeota archaeon]